MDNIFSLSHRQVISISGNDRYSFLQGLITKDVNNLTPGLLFYALFLSSKGRIDFDLFVFCDDHKIYIDTDQPEDLIKRFTMFKLRSDINIERENLKVFTLFNEDIKQKNAYFYKDPRHLDIGWRFYSTDSLDCEKHNDFYDEKRVHLGIPDGLKDMVKGRALPLEWNMDLLHAIDFDKGCYIGQELTARTKYRDLIRKRIIFLNTEDLQNIDVETIASSYDYGALVFKRLEEKLS